VGGKKSGQTDFSEIIKKAYETGRSDETITIQKLMEDLKADLMKLKIDA
jgi:hypothetical protein